MQLLLLVLVLCMHRSAWVTCALQTREAIAAIQACLTHALPLDKLETVRAAHMTSKCLW